MDLELYTPSRPYREGRHAIRYMARLNAQPPVATPRVSKVKSFGDGPVHGGFRRARSVRHEGGDVFTSINAAAKAFRLSDSTIRKCLQTGEMTSKGMFYAESEAASAA